MSTMPEIILIFLFLGYKIKDSEFVWDEYLSFSNAVAAPNELFTMVNIVIFNYKINIYFNRFH